jgi:hypothetical protein
MPANIPGFKRLGFEANPFQHNLAETEPALPDYYVKPPYFDAVFGETDNQTSRIVIGEFGRGKTALRKRIEFGARTMDNNELLCITYDDFPYVSEGRNLAAVSLKD